MRRALAAASMAIAACAGDPDYAGTRYACPDLVCPDGHQCDDGVCVPGEDGAFAFVDDELDGEFDAGTFDGTEWSGTDVRLVAGGMRGEFASRAFDARDLAAWVAIEWVPAAPYGRPLEDGNASEPGYRSGAIDMDGNVLLLHLDPPSLIDTSTNVGTITAVGSAGSEVPSGVFDGAIRTDGGFHLRRVHGDPAPGVPTLDLGARDFTAAVWVNIAADCAAPQTFLGSLAPAELSLSCRDCAPDTGRAVARLDSGGISATACSTTAINDGDWHHVALVKRGHSPATIELFVDGELESTQTASFVDGFDLEDSSLGVGAMPDGSDVAAADLDELAIWARGLDPDEIASLYHRGVARLALSVRVCARSDCGDAVFDDEQPITDSANSFPPAVDPHVDAGSFAQYRCVFETLPGQPSPAVERVSLRGIAPPP